MASDAKIPVRLTLSARIAFLLEQSNELAIGWNDSGCFWHFRWGARGAGSMIEGIGDSYEAHDVPDDDTSLDAAIASFMRHRGFTDRDVYDWMWRSVKTPEQTDAGE